MAKCSVPAANEMCGKGCTRADFNAAVGNSSLKA
jgi:hypothetical protein